MEFIIPSMPFTATGKTLSISSKELVYGDSEDPILIGRDDIKAFRFGVTWIHGLRLPIGRRFHLYIMHRNGKVLKIKFSSLYRYKLKEKGKIFSEIMNYTWWYYFMDKAEDMIEQHKMGREIELNDIYITQEGLELDVHKLFSDARSFIPWHDIGTSDYITYYSVFSRLKPADYHRTFNYLNDWNSMLVNKVITGILESRK
jgi:hypothetical protein